MLDLKTLIDQVCRNATLRATYEFPVRTLRSAGDVTVPNTHLRITRANATNFTVDIVNKSTNQVSPVAMGGVYARAGMITGTAFAKTQYGNVSADPLFHLLYDVKDRALDYIEAGVSKKNVVPSAPCMVCGLVLPLRNLTIDHQKPQTGGALEAVAKTFRAFGLTMEGPKGPKGQKILSHVTQGTVLTPVLTNPGRNALGGTSADARYTLNDTGSVLYSFIAAGGELETLKSNCMHGLLNLRPACQTCNSARGNPLTFGIPAPHSVADTAMTL